MWYGNLQDYGPELTIFLQKNIMKPRKSPCTDGQRELFRTELEKIIDLGHALVKLSKTINWEALEKHFGANFCEKKGRPGSSTRLMVSLHYLKYSHNISDEEVVSNWVENPYWQYFSGMKWFEHMSPIDPSSMTKWRKRVGEAGAEEMLKQTIEAGLMMKVVKQSELKRINVDTTVQEKEIRFPTDSRLYDRAREKLVQAAEKRRITLRQKYNHKGKEMLLMQSRYAHAKQFKRAAKCTAKLKTWLGRVVRDIERKCPKMDTKLSDLIKTSKNLLDQKKDSKNKIYSIHAPEVECISKGKVHKRYEFGCKVSVAATSRGGWIVGAKAFHGNPYDGHTLSKTIEQVGRLAKLPDHAFTDMGYRKHDYEGPVQIHVDKKRRGNTSKTLWRWMKRRAAVEPTIGHLKQDCRLERNRLKGKIGDLMNVLFSAAAMNFRKLLKLAAAFLRLFYEMFFGSPNSVFHQRII
jgi:IS5 family transposase